MSDKDHIVIITSPTETNLIIVASQRVLRKGHKLTNKKFRRIDCLINNAGVNIQGELVL